jgi:aspartate/methionine/tyrosine aminotransferase
MRLADFELERFFARHEFSAPYLLCASDVEGYPMADLLALADGETRALWDGLRLGYTESAGHPLVRAAIAALYEDVTPDEVLVFAGAEEAIFVTANVALSPGDHAIVVWPAYQSLHEVARSVGADVSLHELHESEGWAIDIARLRGQLTPRTRLIVVNAPHNPTGMLADEATLRSLVHLAADAGATLLSDEVYRFLERDPADRLPAGVDLGRHVVSLGVMSKSFALAGLRIGWLATHDGALLERAVRLKDYTTICSSAPSEILALIALRAREAVLARSRSIVEANLALLDPFFDRWVGTVSWIRPRGGSIGFPRLRAGLDVERFADELLGTEGVLIAPGSVFGHPGNHFRLGFGRTDMAAALERFESYLSRSQPGPRPLIGEADRMVT